MSRVLIVDDEIKVLESLKAVLCMNGFKVEIISSSHAIYKSILFFDPKVILLDVNLKNANGIEICKSLKSNVKTKKIPIVLISGDQFVKESINDCQAEDFIEKPFNLDKLLYRLKDYCNTPPLELITGEM